MRTIVIRFRYRLQSLLKSVDICKRNPRPVRKLDTRIYSCKHIEISLYIRDEELFIRVQNIMPFSLDYSIRAAIKIIIVEAIDRISEAGSLLFSLLLVMS